MKYANVQEKPFLNNIYICFFASMLCAIALLLLHVLLFVLQTIF